MLNEHRDFPFSADECENSLLSNSANTSFCTVKTCRNKKKNIILIISFFVQPTEDPTIYLQKRSLSSPLLLFDGSRCLVAIGTTPITTFAKEELGEGLLYLMAYYYTIHLTYPRCVATLLSVIQTEILHDSLHEGDNTPSYKRAMSEWKNFIGTQSCALGISIV